MYLPNVVVLEGVLTPATIVLNGNLGPMQDDEFERRWSEIAEDLSDLTPAPKDSVPPDENVRESEPEASTGAVSGPRDWTTPEEEQDDDDMDAVFEEVAAIARASKRQAPASSPHSIRLWIACVASIVISVLMAFSLLPGGGIVAGIFGIAGFVCGAFAAFATSSSGQDPFDDGARL